MAARFLGTAQLLAHGVALTRGRQAGASRASRAAGVYFADAWRISADWNFRHARMRTLARDKHHAESLAKATTTTKAKDDIGHSSRGSSRSDRTNAPSLGEVALRGLALQAIPKFGRRFGRGPAAGPECVPAPADLQTREKRLGRLTLAPPLCIGTLVSLQPWRPTGGNPRAYR